MSDPCLCDDEYDYCTIHVYCDRGCKAPLDPKTVDELQAAVSHWRSHECTGGCSYGH